LGKAYTYLRRQSGRASRKLYFQMQRTLPRLVGNAKPWKLYPVTPGRIVPPHFEFPPYARGIPISPQTHISLRSKEEIAAQRIAARFSSQIRALAGRHCKPGATTDDIDKAVHEASLKYGFYPSPLGYQGFPKSCCTSVNQVLCHGIPDTRVLQEGDIVKVDVSHYKNGFHGDCCGTFAVGNISDQARKLMNAAKAACHLAIHQCKPGRPFSMIGGTIQNFAESQGLTVCWKWAGHGIGRDFHIPPSIVHVTNTMPGEMQAGMVFTIEPILSLGNAEETTMEDGWTSLAEDGTWAAQHEETILITPTGAEILTQHAEELS